LQNYGNNPDKLTEQEQAYLEEFLSLPDAEARLKWVDEHRNLFECQEGQTAIFHSGWFDKANNIHANRLEAEQFCDEYGNFRNATTLERLPGGKILEEAKVRARFGVDEANIIWGKASETYAASASGAVFTFHHNHNPQGNYVRDELPTLLENDKVTHINYVPISELREIWNQNDDKQLARDLILSKTNPTRFIGYDGDNTPDLELKAGGVSSRIFEIELEGGEKRLLEVEGLIKDEEIRDLNISEEVAERLEKQRPEEPLRVDAEELRKAEKLDISPEPSDEQKHRLEQETQSRIFELELNNGEKRLLEVEGLQPNQDLSDVEMNDKLIEALEKQKPDEPLKISVAPMQEELKQQQKQSHGLGH
jgi:hypothetical protein